MKFLSMRARMPSQIFWSSASTFATYSFAYDACCSLSCSLFVLCNLFLSFSNLSCRLSFLLSLDNLLDLNLHLMFFRSSASFAAVDLASSARSGSCLLPLLLFLCYLPFNSAAFCFSTSISVSISTWCSLAFSATFNPCSAATC